HAATPAPTVTTLSLSSTSVAAGTVVTLSATVAAGGNPVTSGSVTFMDGKRAFGSAQVVISGLAAGSATLKTASFAPGSNAITAIYSGAPNAAEPTAPSTSTPATLTVTGVLSSALSLSAAAVPGHLGNYDLSASLFGFGPASLSGTVSFSAAPGDSILGTAQAGASTYSFAPVQSYSGTSAMNPGPAAVLADFNRDGFLDVAVGAALFFGDPTHPGQFILSSNPLAGIALAEGDFNSDGVPDLIILQGPPGTLGVVLGDPNHPGEFLAGAQFATTGGSPIAAAVGDFNGDGMLDLVVVIDQPGGAYPSVNVFLGDPAHPGQFLPPDGYYLPNAALLASATDVAIGDFNGDGLPDLAVTTAGENSGYPADAVTVMLGDPAHPGQFLAGTAYAAGISPSSVAVGDFNRHGILDLAVANGFGVTAPLNILFGDRNHPGQFLPPAPIDVGEFVNSVTIADFNHDGVADLAVASTSSNNVGVLLGDPANPGAFLPAQFFPIGPVASASSAGPVFVAAADVNGDTLPDLITVNNGAAPVMSVFLDSQTATAQLENVSPGAPGQYSLTASYSGNSGLAASAVSEPLPVVVPHPTTTVLTANPTTGALGTVFALTAAVTVNGKPVTAGSVQFNDGNRILGTAQVIIGGPSVGTAVLKTASFGSGLQSLTAVYSGAPQSAQSTAPSTSAAEVITVTGLAPTTTNLSIVPSIVLPGTYDISATLLAAGSDIGHGTLSVNELSTATSLGSGTITTTGGFLPPQATLDSSQDRQILALADLNGDGIPDLIQSTDGGLLVQFGDPSHPGQFLPSTDYHLTGAAQYIVVGDVNGDGLPDVLVLANQSFGESISLFLNNPMLSGQLEPEQVIMDILHPATGLFLADLNADGVLDIVVPVVLTTGSDVSVWFGNPASPGQFLPPQLLSLGFVTNSTLLGIADFNQDGFNDLAVASAGTTSIFFGNPVHPGQFTLSGQYPQVVTNVSGIGDFNGDGLPDIVGDSVLLLNDAANPGTFSSVPSNAKSALNGAPSDVTFLADLNNDGISDLVVLSQGMLQCD
ncbi:MAG: FG-GAP-like repeat-containing protein, partial [Isosphaeraceae bacterium]